MKIEKVDYTSEPNPFEYCFDAGRNQYWIQNDRSAWIALNETQFKRVLKERGVSPHVPQGDFVSPLDRFLIEAQHKRDVHYAGPLAGHSSGIKEMEGRRVLITEAPRIIEPEAGHWPTIWAVLDGLFQDSQHNQLPYLYGWLKVAYEALRSGEHRPGQALVFAGEPGCGKSLLQNLITLILGGRSARPYQYMAGHTAFNGDLFAGEHLMIEDEQAATEIRSRRNFGQQIKNITVNQWQRCHAKSRTGLSLAPFWRLSITVNDEPENLMVLPPLDDSICDKLIILRASRFELPMPTASTEQRKAFWEQLVRELPGFLDFLLQWQIPSELRSDRFGIAHFHHPAIVEEIDNMAPEFRLLRILEEELFESPITASWEGSADKLERRLCGEGGKFRVEARKLFTYSTACGVYLSRLQKRYPARFRKVNTRKSAIWTIWRGE